MQNPTPSSGRKPNSQPPIKVVSLKELMGSARELLLYHAGATYRLRLTKSNKLILTK